MILFVEIPRILFPIVVIPVVNTSPSGLKVIPAPTVVIPVVNTSPSELNVIPEPTRTDPVVVDPDTLRFWKKVAFVLVLILSVFAMPVNADPSIPGNDPDNCEAGKEVKFAPDPEKDPENVVAVTMPV